ncbi:hypothetical protein [Sphingobium sp.]|uniref:hypothetical protein n=1 Tax=Sphingobium sp. TaxID=1912891 RepID=UPI0029BFFED1|nr:hypothetical protein [Sphingobium sp.]
MKAALAQPAPWMFGAVKIEFPGYTLRLLDGSAQLNFGGETYIGIDPTFGTIDSISEIEEELGDSAPEITLSLFPPDLSATAALSHPDMQGSTVNLMLGAVDPISGSVLGTPEPMFLGEIDVPTVTLEESGQRSVSYSIVSVFERLFETEEGQRASNGYHQSIFPGELGLDFMTGTDVNLYWGSKPPAASKPSTSAVLKQIFR